MSADDTYGYLLVHFVEDAAGHAEKVYFSLSNGDDPLSWRRLRGGEPVLESTQSTTGVRDPYIVRRQDGTGFHVLATDLRVFGRGKPDWNNFTRHGSRDLVVWDSPDLLTWSEPRYVPIAPPSFGMAWAPTVTYDPALQVYRVFFSAKAFGPDDPNHEGSVPAAVYVATTTDFTSFSTPELYLSMSTGVIDLAAMPDGEFVHVLAKHDDGDPESLSVFHQLRRGFDDPDGQIIASRIGTQFGPHVEGPLMFRENHHGRWFCWVDEYATGIHGFRALSTTDPRGGVWEPVPIEEFDMPDNTKHGGILSLSRAEWDALNAW